MNIIIFLSVPLSISLDPIDFVFMSGVVVPAELGSKCNTSRHLRAGLSHISPSGLNDSRLESVAIPAISLKIRSRTR